jgi:phospholipase/carboxylesterase
VQQLKAWILRLSAKVIANRQNRAKIMAKSLNGPRIGPASGGDPRQLVILLHGRGADGAGLKNLVPILAKTLPHAAFVAPNAPYRCSTAPGGYEWFRVPGYDRPPDKIEAGVRSAASILNTFIDDELAEHGLTDDCLALLGFSQGCMMALHVGLRRPNACAAILGYSGRLCAADSLSWEIASRPPVLLCHGAFDSVVPLESQTLAAATIRAAGVEVTTVERPNLGHGFDRPAIDAGAALLARTLTS